MNSLARSVSMFKAMSDPIRLRILHLLTLHDEICVCHLTDAMKLPQSTISRHLGVLRHAGLVQTRRQGKWMYYHQQMACSEFLSCLTLIRDSQLEEDQRALHQALEGSCQTYQSR